MKLSFYNLLSLAFLAIKVKGYAISSAKSIPSSTKILSSPSNVPYTYNSGTKSVNDDYYHNDSLKEAYHTKMLNMKSNCEDYFVYKDDYNYICLDYYTKNIPSSATEMIFNNMISINSNYLSLNCNFSSLCKGGDIYNNYYVVSEMLNKEITSIMPKVNGIESIEVPTEISSSLSESDYIKRIMSETYCQKDNFHILDDKYICLEQYDGSLSTDSNILLDKKIFFYDGKYQIVNTLFSNICYEYSKPCFYDIAKILGVESATLIPKYNDNNENAIEISDDSDLTTEEILDKYYCGTGNFYIHDHKHVCILNYKNASDDQKIYNNNGGYITYSNNIYMIIGSHSSVDVLLPGESSGEIKFNYELIANILGKSVKSIFLDANKLNCKGGKVFGTEDEYVCLLPYKNEIPLDFSDRMAKQIIYFENGFYTIDKKHSTACNYGYNINCEDEFSELLKLSSKLSLFPFNVSELV